MYHLNGICNPMRLGRCPYLDFAREVQVSVEGFAEIGKAPFLKFKTIVFAGKF